MTDHESPTPDADDDPTASPGARNRPPDAATPESGVGAGAQDPPTAAPQGRNRPPDAAMPGGADEPVVARLRVALDELSAGAEPNPARLPADFTARRRAWMLPAVAAAAVAVVVGVGIAVVQGHVCRVFKAKIRKLRDWETADLQLHAGVMRDIRNYGVHPRSDIDAGLDAYFTEDRCGLLFLEAPRHLRRLAALTQRALEPA